MQTKNLYALFAAIGIKAKTVGVTFPNSNKIYHYGCIYPEVQVSSCVVVESRCRNLPYSIGEVVSLVDGLRDEVSSWIVQVIDKERHEQFLAGLHHLDARATHLEEKMNREQSKFLFDRLNMWAATNPQFWDSVRAFYEESLDFKKNFYK